MKRNTARTATLPATSTPRATTARTTGFTRTASATRATRATPRPRGSLPPAPRPPRRTRRTPPPTRTPLPRVGHAFSFHNLNSYCAREHLCLSTPRARAPLSYPPPHHPHHPHTTPNPTSHTRFPQPDCALLPHPRPFFTTTAVTPKTAGTFARVSTVHPMTSSRCARIAHTPNLHIVKRSAPAPWHPPSPLRRLQGIVIVFYGELLDTVTLTPQPYSLSTPQPHNPTPSAQPYSLNPTPSAP